MNLASLGNGRPDGQLVVVSADHARFVSAGRVAPNLLAALDDWQATAPQLNDLFGALNRGDIAGQPFVVSEARAPLPRALQWIDGTGYAPLVTEANAALTAPAAPLFYQGASDSLSGPTDPILVPEDGLSPDFEAELFVITGPVPMRADRQTALAAIRLVGLCNDVSFRALVDADIRQGLGLFHAKPSTAFAPIVATPSAFPGLWLEGKLSARVECALNDTTIGRLDAAATMQSDFADLIMAATRTRALGSGTILGAGTITGRTPDILPLKREGTGYGSLANARAVEKARFGKAVTPYLAAGDRVRIEAFGADGKSLFGPIAQTVQNWHGPLTKA